MSNTTCITLFRIQDRVRFAKSTKVVSILDPGKINGILLSHPSLRRWTNSDRMTWTIHICGALPSDMNEAVLNSHTPERFINDT